VGGLNLPGVFILFPNIKISVFYSIELFVVVFLPVAALSGLFEVPPFVFRPVLEDLG